MKQKMEYAELKAAGLSDAALEIYSDSDLSIYDNGDGTVTMKIHRDIMADSMTIPELEAFFTETLDEE